MSKTDFYFTEKLDIYNVQFNGRELLGFNWKEWDILFLILEDGTIEEESNIKADWKLEPIEWKREHEQIALKVLHEIHRQESETEIELTEEPDLPLLTIRTEAFSNSRGNEHTIELICVIWKSYADYIRLHYLGGDEEDIELYVHREVEVLHRANYDTEAEYQDAIKSYGRRLMFTLESIGHFDALAEAKRLGITRLHVKFEDYAEDKIVDI